jgi:hypothetical protein
MPQFNYRLREEPFRYCPSDRTLGPLLTGELYVSVSVRTLNFERSEQISTKLGCQRVNECNENFFLKKYVYATNTLSILCFLCDEYTNIGL